MFVGRLQQLSEFQCVPKAFVYLAAHLSRDEILEPAMDEALQEIIHNVKSLMAMMAASPHGAPFLGRDVDMGGIEAACGRTSSKDAAVGASLSEAEPDVFPCLVIILGSAFAFLKVSTKMTIVSDADWS